MNSDMEDIRSNRPEPTPAPTRGGLRARASALWERLLGSYDPLEEWVKASFSLMKHNGDLFIGAALSLIGILNFSSGKYCDGNTADYLSCTRPVTYYYYSGFDILIAVIGVFLLLIWFLRHRAK